MCKCRSVEEHSSRSQYVAPNVGDYVVRHTDDSPRVGLLYHIDSYSGGLPRAHVVYDVGPCDHDVLSLYQSPEWALVDPCWQ